jgi:hypothetical protein
LIDDNTLVLYHGQNRSYWGTLAFVRESDIAEDGRHYTLDLICYIPEDKTWDDDSYITTFGSLKATEREFIVVTLPDLPASLEPGNYVFEHALWRRDSEGGWHIWAFWKTEGGWEPRDHNTDWAMSNAVFIGPLPKP